jgi:hypothetical protein
VSGVGISVKQGKRNGKAGINAKNYLTVGPGDYPEPNTIQTSKPGLPHPKQSSDTADLDE